MKEIKLGTESASLPESKQGVPDTFKAQHGQHDKAIRLTVSRPLRTLAIQWSTEAENTGLNCGDRERGLEFAYLLKWVLLCSILE